MIKELIEKLYCPESILPGRKKSNEYLDILFKDLTDLENSRFITILQCISDQMDYYFWPHNVFTKVEYRHLNIYLKAKKLDKRLKKINELKNHWGSLKFPNMLNTYKYELASDLIDIEEPLILEREGKKNESNK